MERLGLRRLVFAGLVVGLAAGFLALAWHVLGGGGWTVWEVLILLCLAANAPWLALAGATGIVGLVLRLLVRDPLALLVPAARHASGPITARTVIAVCIRLEDTEAVLRPASRLLAELHAGPGGDRFTLAILSDTPDGPAARDEAATASRLAARFPAGAVLYRRRESNHGFKAGNLMSFLDGDAASGFDFVLVLDADSLMSAEAVRRLVRIMAADPRLAILQPTVAGHGADTPFARLFGLGHRHAVRIWATGQAWWQGPQGPYWGHNALIRMAPFRTHARLPALPDGEVILSHDHVEAALLHAAGWAVRVLPDDAGSAERHPPDLPAMFARDARWAAGNLQYRHLLRRRDLGRIGRLQMTQAILHYLLAPLWFAPLPLAAINVATGGGEGTPRGALVALVALGFLGLHLPRIAGHLEAAIRRRVDRVPPRDALRESALAVLLDPIAALDRTVTLCRLGRSAGWDTQARDGRGLAWSAGWRRFGAHAAVGAILAALFASGGAFALAVAAPALAGLVAAVPVAVSSAGGRRRGAAPPAPPRQGPMAAPGPAVSGWIEEGPDHAPGGAALAPLLDPATNRWGSKGPRPFAEGCREGGALPADAQLTDAAVPVPPASQRS